MRNFSKYDCKFYALGVYAHTAASNKDVAPGETFMIDLEKDPFNMSPADAVAEEKTNRVFYVFTKTQIEGIVIGVPFFK
jgi:hypothetical protein